MREKLLRASFIYWESASRASPRDIEGVFYFKLSPADALYIGARMFGDFVGWLFLQFSGGRGGVAYIRCIAGSSRVILKENL